MAQMLFSKIQKAPCPNFKKIGKPLWKTVDLGLKVSTNKQVVWVFSDILVAFLYFDICHYRQTNLAIENPEFTQPVVAVHFQWKIW